MLLSDLLLIGFQSLLLVIFCCYRIFFDEYTSVFLRELLIEMTDSSGRGIDVVVIRYAVSFSQLFLSIFDVTGLVFFNNSTYIFISIS